MKKSWIVVLALLVILIGIISFRFITSKSVSLTDEKCFEISDKGVITSYKQVCGTEVNIPKKINGVEVKEIAKYVFRELEIEKVILPDTLEVIGIGAFENNAIESLVLPDSVKVVKPYAFYKNQIKKLEIGAGVEDIGIYAFNDNQVSKNPFIYSPSDDKMIVGYAGKNRDEVVIPDEVTYIYTAAFADCGIKKIKLNKDLERIGSSAFENNNLTTITIPKNVIYVGENVFTGNKDLEKIKVYDANIITDETLKSIVEVPKSEM